MSAGQQDRARAQGLTLTAHVAAGGDGFVHVDRRALERVISRRATASAPPGSAAPVEMATAHPASNGSRNGCPAALSPIAVKAPGVSAALTAQPSMPSS